MKRFTLAACAASATAQGSAPAAPKGSRGCRGGEELYDHLEDPNEWRNVAADSDHRATLEKMRKQMDAVLGFRLADELTQHQSDADMQPISDATSPATGDQRR